VEPERRRDGTFVCCGQARILRFVADERFRGGYDAITNRT
jgi:hypothetical protein